jgi:hypothetical protein
MEATSAILQLAGEEQRNVEKHLELLGDTYDLNTLLENLYDTLPKHCRFPLDVATNDAAHAAGVNAHLMFVCRRELTVGTLTLLRGYRIDFLFHLRKAIELCAFAARMAKHPAMSRIWIQARTSDDAWEKFRDKFKKLFPKDDPELTNLHPSYDEASVAMHSSPVAVAQYLSGKRIIAAVPNIGVFDLTSEAVFIAYFIRAVHCHITILAVFERILKPYSGDTTAWSRRLHSAKVAFSAKHTQWTPLVQTGLKTAKAKTPTNS